MEPIQDFKVNHLDFKELLFPKGITINKCYTLFRTSIVTFYLHTKVAVIKMSTIAPPMKRWQISTKKASTAYRENVVCLLDLHHIL